MNPTVSVVIKSYNHAPYVGESLRSVFDQSFQDFEIVVTDDGSTDGTPDIIAGLADPRIRLERFTHNRGACSAMNSATARARGEFIAILNSDDFALPGRLETQVTFLRSNPEVAAVFGAPRPVGESGEAVPAFEAFASPFSEPRVGRQRWLRHFFFHGNCLCAPTAMIRTAAYRETGGYDPRYTNLADLDRWIRLLEVYEIQVLPDEFTAFRVRDSAGNLSARRRDSMLRAPFELFQIFKQYRSFEPGFLREIFAEDIERHGIDARRPNAVWLAEIARLGEDAWHPLFALDCLFEGAVNDDDFRRLSEWTGSLNVLRLPEVD